MYRYLIIVEKAERNYSAYSPDLPGCVATGKTKEEVTRNMQEAIELHLQGMVEDQVPIPAPRTYAEYITVPMQWLPPTYAWEEISETGKRVNCSSCPTSIGFDFPFFENHYRELFIESGFITFGERYEYQQPSGNIPSPNEPNNQIAVSSVEAPISFVLILYPNGDILNLKWREWRVLPLHAHFGNVEEDQEMAAIIAKSA